MVDAEPITIHATHHEPSTPPGSLLNHSTAYSIAAGPLPITGVIMVLALGVWREGLESGCCEERWSDSSISLTPSRNQRNAL